MNLSEDQRQHTHQRQQRLAALQSCSLRKNLRSTLYVPNGEHSSPQRLQRGNRTPIAAKRSLGIEHGKVYSRGELQRQLIIIRSEAFKLLPLEKRCSLCRIIRRVLDIREIRHKRRGAAHHCSQGSLLRRIANAASVRVFGIRR